MAHWLCGQRASGAGDPVGASTADICPVTAGLEDDTMVPVRSSPALPAVCLLVASSSLPGVPAWEHLSSRDGDLPEPNGGTQQTACVAFDVDADGRTDIIVAERTRAPAVIWLRPTAVGWATYVVDDSRQHPEAGGLAYDVDGDGHPDLIIGGDASSDELWWYENPAPDFDPARPWKRHLIKKGGGKAHHDRPWATSKVPAAPSWLSGTKGPGSSSSPTSLMTP